MATVKLSIIIVNWNAGDVLKNCVKSVYDTCDMPFEAIVVDNHSSDNSVVILKDSFPNVILLEQGMNLGFSRANNIGARRASGEYLLFLNPDAVLLPGAAGRMADFLEKHPEVGIIGPKIMDGSGAISKYGKGALPNLRDDLLRLFLIKKCVDGVERILSRMPLFKERLYTHYRTSGICECLSGSCFLLRKKFFDSLGGFDERLPMYLDDIDLCRRSIEKGFSNFYLAEAEVIHLEQRSTKKLLNYKMHGVFSMQAEIFYYKKHFTPARVIGYKLIVLLSIPYLLLLDMISIPYFLVTGRMAEKSVVIKNHLYYFYIVSDKKIEDLLGS